MELSLPAKKASVVRQVQLDPRARRGVGRAAITTQMHDRLTHPTPAVGNRRLHHDVCRSFGRRKRTPDWCRA